VAEGGQIKGDRHCFRSDAITSSNDLGSQNSGLVGMPVVVRSPISPFGKGKSTSERRESIN